MSISRETPSSSCSIELRKHRWCRSPWQARSNSLASRLHPGSEESWGDTSSSAAYRRTKLKNEARLSRAAYWPGKKGERCNVGIVFNKSGHKRHQGLGTGADKVLGGPASHRTS